MSNNILQKEALAKLLLTTRTSLANWRREGAPIREDLSADPVQVCVWYVSGRPIFRLSIQGAMRLKAYREIGLRLLDEREKRKAKKKAR